MQLKGNAPASGALVGTPPASVWPGSPSEGAGGTERKHTSGDLLSELLDDGDERFDFDVSNFAFERGHFFFALLVSFPFDNLLFNFSSRQLALG
jgi:hypothetical protein